VKRLGTNEGKASIVMILGIGLVMGLLLTKIPLPPEVREELTDIEATFEDGLEIITSKTYTVFTNVKWSEIKAAGIKVTETGLKGFLQICERLALNLGNLKIYADIEARVMWVYSNSSSETADTEVYYVQFL